MQYLPYVQGTTPNLPADGQYGDSPVSKFGLAKGAQSASMLRSNLEVLSSFLESLRPAPKTLPTREKRHGRRKK